jgi:hypothetical protein
MPAHIAAHTQATVYAIAEKVRAIWSLQRRLLTYLVQAASMIMDEW